MPKQNVSLLYGAFPVLVKNRPLPDDAPLLKWVESRLPWRQLGTTIPPSRLEVLERRVNGLKQMDFVLHDICLM